ncbi:MAG: ATP-binding cassette domain-containing protein [Anaerolineales bacterium]|jgi:energy-coupling factor transport system ATP-binding protein
MIQVRDLSVSYASVPALSGINLDVKRGQCLLVTGPSGCGKSTLARALTGLIPHTIPATIEGTVQVAGLDICQHTVPELTQQVGVVFQNPSSQLFHLRVEDELAFGPRNLGLSVEQVNTRVSWALEAVGLNALRECRPCDLSGGQKQLVAIAAALAMRSQVLVLDEPTASLDVPGTNYVMTALQDLRDKYGVTIVLIEHRLAEAVQLADRVIILDQGRIVAEGRTEQVLFDRAQMRRLGLRRPVDEPLASWDALLLPDGIPPVGIQPLIEFDRVSAGYERRPVIHDVDLALYPGEFVALVGNNGAGKSTLALVAAGLLKPIKGNIIHTWGKQSRPGLDVTLLFQNPTDQLFADTVDEEIAFGPRNYQIFDPVSHKRVLDEADLLKLTVRKPFALSAGQQQRTALAACLSLHPQLIILDEPTLGQDWGHLQRLMDFLNELNQKGMTILLITHDYKLVHHYARRVILMEGGHIILDGRNRNNRNRNKQNQEPFAL